METPLPVAGPRVGGALAVRGGGGAVGGRVELRRAVASRTRGRLRRSRRFTPAPSPSFCWWRRGASGWIRSGGSRSPRRRGARPPGALLFNGTQLRLVDAGRLYARRFARVRRRPGDRRRANVRGVLVAAARSAFQPRPAATPRRRDASSRRPIGTRRRVADRCATASSRPRPTCSARCSAGEPRADAAAARRHVRAGADDRLSHAVSAVRRGARRSCRCGIRCTARATASSRCAPRPSGRRRRPGCGTRLRAIARLAHAGCRAGDLRVTPFNGRLFAPARTPLAERRDLDDEAARRAVLALSTRPAPDRAGPRADRVPRSRRRATRRRLRNAARLRAARSTGRAAGGARPRAGRRSLRAAAPAFARRPARSTRRSRSPIISSAGRSARWCATPRPNGSSQLRVVDPAMGSGAFLVAACRYLADAYEAALVRDGRLPRQRLRRARARRRSGGRSPSDVCSASTSTRWRCSSRGCRSGWRRSPPTGR